MIKNIILDVGKVLVAWEPYKEMQELGFDETTMEAVANATVSTEEWNESDRGALSEEEILSIFIKKAPAFEKEIRLFWQKIALAITQYPYTIPWIQSMKKAGYKVYILSNYARWTYEQTKDTGLSFLPYVDDAIFSYQIKQIKPDLEIYQTLLRKFDLVAEECVFLDDREDNIQAAIDSGIHGIQFESLQQANEELMKLGVTL